MSKLQFTPEDFKKCKSARYMRCDKECDELTETAQARFDDWLSEAVRVYCNDVELTSLMKHSKN